MFKNRCIHVLLMLVVLSGLLVSCGKTNPDESNGDSDIDSTTDGDMESGEQEEVELVQIERLEPFRPQLHFSPLSGWMNDPNGLIYHEGEFHLFYQFGPESLLLSPIHWGHAVSRDLFHWEDLPIALYPDDTFGKVYSGSSITDLENRSGLCEIDGEQDASCLIAIFTHAGGDIGGQKQSLAVSRDRGRNFTMYEGNPVLTAPDGQADFRDPKVFFHEQSDRWIMPLAEGDRIGFYASENLKDWTWLSDFEKQSGDDTGMWECPDLFPLSIQGDSSQRKWVLLVSVFSGGPQGGSGVRSFIGEFDGTTFTCESERVEPGWLDWGSDFYAWQSFADASNERRIGLAWMNNWSYAPSIQSVPWQGAMSLPRELTLIDSGQGKWSLRQSPVAEFENLSANTQLELQNDTLSESEPIVLDGSKSLDIQLQMEQSGEELILSVESNGETQAQLTVNTSSQTLIFERQQPNDLDAPSSFAGQHEAPLSSNSKSYSLRVILDRSSLEAFINDGELALTEQIFPDEGEKRVRIATKGGDASVTKLTVREIDSVWLR